MKTFEYVNQQGVVLGYGCRVGNTVIINPKSEEGWFDTRKEAKKAGLKFKLKPTTPKPPKQ